MARCRRLAIALVLLVGQLVAFLPDASAQSAQMVATWTPRTLDATKLNGNGCAAGTACTVARGATYTAQVQFTVDHATEPLLIGVDPGGLDVQATDAATGADFTRALAANQVETINLQITIPDATGRRDRSFYIGHVTLQGGAGRVPGSLTISLNVPTPRISWTRQTDPSTGDKAPITTIIGSGAVVNRNITLRSNIDVADFSIAPNTDRAQLANVPADLAANADSTISFSYTAPIVNRRTNTDVILRPVAGGVQALEKALRIRIVVLPAEVQWSPPTLRQSLLVQDQRFVPATVRVTSNYDVPGVTFRTADIGLTPIVAPVQPVDLKAGVPQEVTLRLCPGYAPTTYFLGIVAYQGNKPLNKRLQIRMKVEDNGSGLPINNGKDPCAQ
ncbi:MAG TPA: hypothetical protein VFC93_19850 [Chloroflexota bacterium]|nr:hypothetical protein [Chloroflexota bacterium]